MTSSAARTARTIAVLLLLGLTGSFLYARYRDEVFRSAALDLRLSRPEAIGKAERFLRDRGYELAGAERSAAFFSDEDPILYFEKKAGTARTNDWLRSGGLPVWGWHVRFFWPLTPDEYEVWWTPAGELLGFRHTPRPGESQKETSPSEALAIARTFAGPHPLLSLDGFTLAERSSDRKVRQTEHRFGWKSDSNLLESRLFLRAEVAGGELVSFRREIEIPESFSRSENEIGSRRDLLSLLAGQADWLLHVGLFLFLIAAWRRRWVRWKPALLLAGVVTLVRFLDLANGLPFDWHAYGTDETVSAFWLGRAGLGSLALLGAMIWSLLQLSSSDAMGRSLPGAPYSLGELARGSFYHSPSFVTATLAGLGAAGIQLGFVVLYYRIGREFLGFYAPLEIPFSDLLTSSIPWIQPLLIGLTAAVSEESVYRLFAIPLLLRWSRRTWVALLVPAALWGFLHTTYYVEPIYARGLELTVVGLFFGFIFLRFGIWATIVGHYTYNAAVAGSVFFGADDFYVRGSSALAIGIFGIPLAVSLLRMVRGRPLREFSFHPVSWPAAGPAAWSGPDRRRAARREPPLPFIPPVAAMALLLIAFTLFPPAPPLPAMDLDRPAAVEFARSQLTAQGYFLERHLVTAVLRPVERTVSDEEAGAPVRGEGTGAMRWSVRFVTPGSAEECATDVEEGRRLTFFACRVGEETPGASLSEEASRRIAERFLASRGYTVSDLRYVGMEEHDRPARKDFDHRWTDPRAGWPDVRREIRVGVAGDRISSFEADLRVAESPAAPEPPSTVWETLRDIFLVTAVLILAGMILRALFDREVARSLLTPLAAQIALGSSALVLLDWINSLPHFWSAYDSASSVQVYLALRGVSLLGRMLTTGLLTYFAVLLFLRLAPQIFPTCPTEEDLRRIVRRPPWRWRSSRSALLWAVALVTVQAFVRHLLDSDAAGSGAGAFSSAIPVVTLLRSTWTGILFWISFAALLAAFLKYLTPTFTSLAMLLLVWAIPLTQDSGPEQAVPHVLNLLLALFVVVRWIRFNPAFYLWYSLLSAILPFLPWLVAGHRFFRFHAFLAATLLLLVILTLFRPAATTSDGNPET